MSTFLELIKLPSSCFLLLLFFRGGGGIYGYVTFLLRLPQWSHHKLINFYCRRNDDSGASRDSSVYQLSTSRRPTARPQTARLSTARLSTSQSSTARPLTARPPSYIIRDGPTSRDRSSQMWRMTASADDKSDDQSFI